MLKKAINCINKNLISIYSKSAELEQLGEQINKHLPKNFIKHVKIASFDKGVLIISCKNSMMANELRFLLPELRTTLRQQEKLYNLANIKLIREM